MPVFPCGLLLAETCASSFPGKPGRCCGAYPPLVFEILGGGDVSGVEVSVGVKGGRLVPRAASCASSDCVGTAGRLFALRGVVVNVGVVAVGEAAAADIAAAMACGFI